MPRFLVCLMFSVRLCPVLGVTLVFRETVGPVTKPQELKPMLEEKTVNGGSTLLFFLFKK